jgi:cytochrome c-type biogenesis protein CcmH
MKWLCLLLCLTAAAPALAVQPDEMLSDPGLEARARAVGRDLRCLVCQNQSIDDSDADLARDLRILVRERIKAGDSDAQVRKYLVDRYGDYVLLNPPLKTTTLVLWGGPGLLLLAAGGALAAFYRRRSATAVEPSGLTEDETKRLAALLEDTKDS